MVQINKRGKDSKVAYTLFIRKLCDHSTFGRKWSMDLLPLEDATMEG